MKIEKFKMERMQSCWENVVDYDMSESGIRAVTLKELCEMGFDLDKVMDMPLSYSQSNGTIELRELLVQRLTSRFGFAGLTLPSRHIQTCMSR